MGAPRGGPDGRCAIGRNGAATPHEGLRSATEAHRRRGSRVPRSPSSRAGLAFLPLSLPPLSAPLLGVAVCAGRARTRSREFAHFRTGRNRLPALQGSSVGDRGDQRDVSGRVVLRLVLPGRREPALGALLARTGCDLPLRVHARSRRLAESRSRPMRPCSLSLLRAFARLFRLDSSTTDDVMRAEDAARRWKPLELLEFEAVFAFFECIDEATPVNRTESAENSINSCFRMSKAFRCEHLGPDRCTRPRAGRAAERGPHGVSHPRPRAGFGLSACQPRWQQDHPDAGNRTKSSKSHRRRSTHGLRTGCAPFALHCRARAPKRGTEVPNRVAPAASGGASPSRAPFSARSRPRHPGWASRPRRPRPRLRSRSARRLRADRRRRSSPAAPGSRERPGSG